MKHLSSQDIAYFGAGANRHEAQQPLLLNCRLGSHTVQLVIYSGFEYLRKYDVMYSFYADENQPGVLSLTDQSNRFIDNITDRGQKRFSILFPHWGNNYKWITRLQAKHAGIFLKNGIDLILGHGAHMLQEIEYIEGHWVVYNLGNFMFNSPGRYQKMYALPYSLIARLDLRMKGDKIILTLRLYPIYTDNRKNRYRGRFVTDEELQTIINHLKDRSTNKELFTSHIETGKDCYGPFLEVLL